MRRVFLVCCLLLAPALCAQIANDDAIRQLLAQRVDRERQGMGIVVGVIEPAGRRVVAHGTFSAADRRAAGGDTVFEIGSVTKVFTALLLTDMVRRREVALDDPVTKCLPPEVTVPRRNGRPITFADLATHTSGLPRLPANLAPGNPFNPYVDYTAAQLYEALGKAEPAHDPGTHYEYSNLGAGLLGHALSRCAGMDFEALLRKRILDPLGMSSTAITLTADMAKRLAPGHDAGGKPAPNWDFAVLAGAGALRSTVNDMLTFVATALGDPRSPLRVPMARMLATRRPTGQEGTVMALGWHVSKWGGREIVWHNGGTGGYRSFVGFDPKARIGVVALSNMFTVTGVDDIGRSLLAPEPQRAEVKVDAKVLERYVGHYELAPGFFLSITREGDQLFLQATGQPRFPLYPESDTKFFLKVVEAQVVFEPGAEGDVPSLVLHQNGERRAQRIEGEPPPPKVRRQAPVDPQIFEGYVGRYQLAPGFVLEVTREGDQLYVQASGQPRFPVYPESEREFFYKVVDARITFVTGEKGRAVSLVLHQNGAELPGKRID